MAEVAALREMFADILSLVAGLRAPQTGVEVRYGDGTMGEARLFVSKAACFGAAVRPRGGYDALPDSNQRLLNTPEGAILASNEAESGECRLS
jgi:hypothetical protein